MMNDIAIKVENLSKVYKLYDHPQDRLKEALNPFGKKYHHDYYALNDISFEVKRGETVGIIGRNGAGKSTLLKIITGVLTPTEGSVQVNGRIASLLELGAGFNPEMTGLENIFFSGTIMGFTHAEMETKLEAILAFAEIGEFIHQPVKTYSSGMYVRLAFAINVAIEPEILIIDEALAVGDALFQKRCYQHMEKLVANGTTLLFVSHEQESIRTLTNRAILLSHGKIDTIGTSAEVILEYRRQLHEEEKEYFKHLVTISNDEAREIKEKPKSRSKTIDFGSKQAEILNVSVLDHNYQSKSTFYPNEVMIIKINVLMHSILKNLNIGIRIRNKEGVKIYSAGTLNQDILNRSYNKDNDIFWEKEFNENDNIDIFLKMQVNLGVNLYEIQASVSFEEYPYYGSQHILDWKDESAFFTVVMNQKEYFYGGVCNMNMEALWK